MIVPEPVVAVPARLSAALAYLARRGLDDVEHRDGLRVPSELVAIVRELEVAAEAVKLARRNGYPGAHSTNERPERSPERPSPHAGSSL